MRCVAIIPAHNEAPRIGDVVRPLITSGRFEQVVVVDDGSVDGTSGAAIRAGARVIPLAQNHGKGGAMLVGVRATTSPVVCFFDADLVGLHPAHANWLLSPIEHGAAGMVVGLMDYGVYNQIQTALPLISGQRAVLRSVLDAVDPWEWSGFSIEAHLNAAARRLGVPVLSTPLNGVSQVPKWHKVGVQRGVSDGVKMLMRVLVATRDAK